MTVRLQHLALAFATTAEVVDVAGFFADVLHLPVSGQPAEGYAEVDAGAVTVSLLRGLLDESLVTPLGGFMLQLGCDDTRAEVEALRARGADVALEPVDTDWGTTSAYVTGPHGLLVEVFSWRDGQSPA